jgi:hypothetical protein
MRVQGCQRRRGLSRIDVLVIVVIGVILLGILLTLLPRLREGSYEVQCKFNLQQIGGAIARFHDRQRFLPASRIDDGYATWAVQIGADLSVKGDNLLRAWDEQKPYAAQADAARQVQVPQYYCPARRRPDQLSTAGDDGPDGKLLPGALGDYACAAGNSLKPHPWDGPEANGTILLGQVLKRKENLVLEWRGRTRLEDLGDNKAYKILLGDKHVPLGKFGQAAAGDGSLYNGASIANVISAARVAGPGYGLAASPEAPFNSNFGSYHQGGVCQFLMADGAIKTFTPSVDETVLGRFTDRQARPEKK